MNNYQCRYGLWHDKPCMRRNPSSNNGFTYSAYAKHLLGDDIDHRNKQYQTFVECAECLSPIVINRLPNKKTPVLSKDEVIGMVSLGFLTRAELEKSHWNFNNLTSDMRHRKLTPLSLFRAVRSLWKIRKEHRNHFWENGMTETYCLAFRLPPWDIYYVKRYYGRKASLLETILFYLNSINVLTKGNKSSRMLLWLQLKDLRHPLLRFIDQDKWVKNYFGEEHPFVTGEL